ncbi:MAG: tyrosine-type recombinase/integrase [Fusobacteriaceae bacterium]
MKKRVKKSNGEGSVWQVERKGKPYYRASVVIGKNSDGNPIRKTFSGYKKSEVIEKMQKALYEVKSNIFTSEDNITFGQFFKEWIFDFKRNEISSNTFAEYEVCYRTKIQSYEIAQLKLKDITPNSLQKYFNILLNSEGISVNCIKKVYVKIKACLQFAIIQNIILRNPIIAVTLPKGNQDEKYKVFSKDEQKLIIDRLGNDVIDKVVLTGFFTGLRLGEILALQWSDIEDGILKISRQYQKNIDVIDVGVKKLSYVFKDLKTEKSKREIPLTKNIMKLFSEMDKKNQLIFCGKNGEPIERKRPTRRLNKLCRDLNIRERSFHSVRHTYATRMFELDVPVKTVQVLLGHSEIATTMDIYTHVMTDKKVEAIEKLNNLFK